MNSFDAQTTLDLGARVLAPTYKQAPALFVRGDGATLVDATGRAYLDMTSGIAVNALGHGAPLIQNAVREAATGLIHTSNLYFTQPSIMLAADLTERSFADRVFFCNSGAEAIEGAIKFARLCGGAERRRIVYFDGSFHGRTFGALAATDRPGAQQPFEPLPEGFSRASWDDSTAFEAIDSSVAAVLVEPIQGEGGVRVPSRAWLRGLRERCDAEGALLIFDEIQAGLGRTGQLWAHEHFDVTPDMMALAKPLAGGLPMGAVLMTEQVAGPIQPGCHATTFGGGPFVASVALAVFRQLSDPTFLRTVTETGQSLRDRLERIAGVEEARGLGLLLGVRVEAEPAAVVAAAFEEGLLVAATAQNVVRFLPPLNVSQRDLDDAVERFSRALKRVVAA